ncbi:MAG: hypothetical protein WBZ28_19770 [Pseudolabrys sp.]
MRAPLIATLLALLGGLFLLVSAFLGVTAAADWTILAAETCFVLAVIIFLGWFLAGCVSEIRKA